MDAAVAAGVRRIVKLSAAPAEPGSPVAFWDWHAQVERHLRASRTDWVILRASWYMSNLLAAASRVAAEGRLYAPAGQARIAMIDPRDVGAAAAAVLCSPGHGASAGHEGQTYLLTGPRAITYDEVAAGLAAQVSPDIETLTGSPPPPRLRRFRPRPCAPVRARCGGGPAMTEGNTMSLDANKALIRSVFETVIPAGDAAGLRDLVAGRAPVR